MGNGEKSAEMAMSEGRALVISQETVKLSPWVTLSTKYVMAKEGSEPDVYHSLKQSDYVTALVVRTDGLIPVVKQYRPAVEQFTFELPGGLVDRSSSPESVAISEVYEETGHKVIGKPHLLGCLHPDTGRLENRLWTFYAEVSSNVASDWMPEAGVELVLVSKSEFYEMVCDGRFNHALHLGVIGLALTKGFFSW